MASVQFYPVDVDYATTSFGRAIIRLFGVTHDGKNICCIDRGFEPYFYAIPKIGIDDAKLIEDIKEIKDDDSFVTNAAIEEKRYLSKKARAIKVFVNHPKDVPIISSIVADHDSVIDVVEKDILFARRYLIDKGITPLTICSASGSMIRDETLNADIVFDAECIKSDLDDLNELRALSFDIETYTSQERYSNSKKDPIISAAFWSEDFKKVITWKKVDTDLDVAFVKNEAELIQEFVRTIKEYRPSCLVGYFSDGFDIPYLIERGKVNGIKLNIGADNSAIKIGKQALSHAKITGVVHLDLIRFVRIIMGGSLQLDNYSLNEVAHALVGERKNDLDAGKIGIVWDSNSNEIADILEYNLKDAELTYKIFRAISFDVYELSRLIGQPIDDVVRMSFGQLVEWYLIKKAKDFNELIPNKPRYDEKSYRLAHTYQGAFVYQPTPGLYKDIVIFDFKSLYPSIIVAHNIDPGMLTESKKGSYESPPITGEDNRETRHYFSYNEEGFIPSVLKDIILRRNRVKEIIKKEKKKNKILEARSYMLKIVANATYGMFGYSGARWYSKECAAAITSFGRDYILKTIESAKKIGYNIVLADTDSVAFTLGGKTKEDALNFMKEINEGLPSLMELELENFYSYGIFVMKKGGIMGAKKKYALVDEEGILKIRGFEAVRRNWSYIAKEVQIKVLETILKENSVEKAFEYTMDIINKIRNKKIGIDKMIIKTQLRKDIKNYDNIGPHVRVAERMKRLGISAGAGSIVSYVVTEGTGIIRDRAKLPEECMDNEYDADYYINNQIIPAVGMIFEAVDHSKNELVERKDQSKLNKFFGG